MPKQPRRIAPAVSVALGLLISIAASGLAARQAQTPAAQRTPASTGVVSGIVIDGTTSRPIAGAVVFLTQTPRTPTGTAVRQVTDARGRFVFSGLPPAASLTLGATRTGYFDQQLAQSGLSTQTLALAEGEWLRDLRVTLWKGGAVEGIVRDERGEPIVAIEVRAVAIVRPAGSDQLAEGPGAMTDDRGRYRISGLLPARYLVAVPSLQTSIPASRTDAELLELTEVQFANLEGRRARQTPVATIQHEADVRVAVGPYPTPPPVAGPKAFGYPLTFSPGSSVPNPANGVDVGFGDTRTLDVSLTPVPTGSVSGRIDGAEQIANRLVRLLAAGTESLGFGFETAAARTEGDGSFRLANVPAGDYLLDVPIRVNEYQFGVGSTNEDLTRVLPGLGRFVRPADAIPGGPTGLGFYSGTITRLGSPAPALPPGSAALFARVAVTVSAGSTAAVVVPLRPSATVAGRVRFDSDTTGLAPVSVTVGVVLEPANGSPSQGRAAVTVSTLDGTGPNPPFTISGALPGRYFIRLSLARIWTIRSVTIQGRDYTNTAVDLTSTPRLDDVEVTLTRSAATITGTVTTAAGAPAAGARVCVFPVDSSRWTDFGLTPPWLAAATTSQQGAYSIGPVPAGEYYVAVVPRANMETWRDSTFFSRAAANAPRVSVGWGESRTQPLRSEGR